LRKSLTVRAKNITWLLALQRFLLPWSGTSFYATPFAEEGQFMGSKSKWLYVGIVALFSIGLLSLLSGCSQNAASPENGTITLHVSGADAHNGAYFYFAIVAEGADVSNQANWLADSPTSPTIAGGTVDATAVEVGGNTPVIFTGGERYDASGILDVDNSGDPTSGDYLFGPKTIMVDGDTILELVYPTDFTVIP
jgi:hypothetical protein